MTKKGFIFILAVLIFLAWHPGIVQGQSAKDYPNFTDHHLHGHFPIPTP